MSDGKPVYVVLGATGAIGSEVSRQLYAKGCNLMLGARMVEKLDTLQEELEDSIYFSFDADRLFEVERCIEHAINMWGRVDGVLNCIGQISGKPSHQTTEDEWNELLHINLSSSFAAVHAASTQMLAEGGSIVLIGAQAGLGAIPNMDAFSAVTAGVMGLTKAASETYNPFNIRVNCVVPGFVRTPAGREFADKAPDGVPVHDAADVAKVMAWLAEPGNPLTGQTLGVDEGLSKIG